MNLRRMTCISIAICAPVAIWFAFAAQAAEPAEPKALSARLSVAKVDGSRAFSGFQGGKRVQERLMSLQREHGAARQSGDQQKAEAIGQQFSEVRGEVQRLMMDAVRSVADERDIDIVLNVRAGQNGTSELDTVYRDPEVDVPDITDAVVSQINKLAETRPALESATTAPAGTQPAGLRLQTRPSLRLQPNTPAPRP